LYKTTLLSHSGRGKITVFHALKAFSLSRQTLAQRFQKAINIGNPLALRNFAKANRFRLMNAFAV
jgi:hypothetical protein